MLQGGQWLSLGLSGKDRCPQGTGSMSFQRGPGAGPPWWSCREFGGRKVLHSAVYVWALLVGARYLGGLRAMRCAWGSIPTTFLRRPGPGRQRSSRRLLAPPVSVRTGKVGSAHDPCDWLPRSFKGRVRWPSSECCFRIRWQLVQHHHTEKGLPFLVLVIS